MIAKFVCQRSFRQACLYLGNGVPVASDKCDMISVNGRVTQMLCLGKDISDVC